MIRVTGSESMAWSPACGARSSEIGGLLKILSGAGINLTGIMSRSLLGFIFTVIISRVLPLPDLGFYTLGTALITLLGYLCLMGMDSGLWHFIAVDKAAGNAPDMKQSISVALGVGALSGLVACVLLLFFAAPIAQRAFGSGSFAGPVRGLAVTLPLLVVARLFTAATQGMQKMRYSAAMEVGEQGLKLFLTAILFMLGLKLNGVLFASAVAAGFSVILSWLFYHAVFSGASLQIPDISRLRRLLKFSLPMGASLIFTHLILWDDTFFLGLIRGPAEAGLYSVAARLINSTAIILVSSNLMLAPVISELHSREASAAVERLFKRITRWIFTVSLPFFIPLIIFRNEVLTFFGERFNLVASGLAILAAGQLINVLTGPVGAIICMRGRPRIEAINSGVAWLVNAGMCVGLIARYGMIGAALANAATVFLVNAARVVEVRLLFGIHAYDRNYLKPAAAGLIAGGAVLAGSMIFSGGLLALSVMIVVFQAVYCLMIYFLGLEKIDVEVAQMLKLRLSRTRSA